jgi:hypothetical protein
LLLGRRPLVYIPRMPEADIQVLMDGSAAELGCAITLTDVNMRLLAHTEHKEVIDKIRRRSIMGRAATPEVRAWFEQWGMRDSSGPVRTPADPKLGALERWCIPVRFRGMHFGYVWVLDGGDLPQADLEPGVQAAEQIGALLYRRRLSLQADTDILRLLLIPNPENEHIASELLASGVHTYDGPVAVVVAGTLAATSLDRTALDDLALIANRAAERASAEAVLNGVISEHAVLLAPLRKLDDLRPAERLAAEVSRTAIHFNPDLDLVAAIGGAADLERASHSYVEARRAIRMARSMPQLGRIVMWDRLGVFRALAFLPPAEVEQGVLDPRVRELLADHELAATAELFLDLAGNVQETAARLFVHRATLYQRLDRIMARHKLDLRRNGDDRLLTHLGLKLARASQLELHAAP